MKAWLKKESTIILAGTEFNEQCVSTYIQLLNIKLQDSTQNDKITHN